MTDTAHGLGRHGFRNLKAVNWNLSVAALYEESIRRGEGLFQPAMDRIIDVLGAGGCVRVFPEGTRSRSGTLGHGRPGVGRVLYETGVTVVPCFHRGLDQLLPIGSVIPRIGKRVDIVIGPPFSVDDLRESSPTKGRLLYELPPSLVHEEVAWVAGYSLMSQLSQGESPRRANCDRLPVGAPT